MKIVPDNYAYARCAQMIGDRKQLTAEKIPELEEFLMDSSRAVAIVDAAKMSMGNLLEFLLVYIFPNLNAHYKVIFFL